MSTIQNCWNSAKILPCTAVVARGPARDVIAELQELLTQFSASGFASAEEMCDMPDERWTTAPVDSDDDVELIEAVRNLPPETDEDDSVYKPPVSLKVMRQYMEEAKYFIQENQPAMQRHLAPMTALLKDLSVMQVTSRTMQVGIRAFCSPMASTDADASAAGAKAD